MRPTDAGQAVRTHARISLLDMLHNRRNARFGLLEHIHAAPAALGFVQAARRNKYPKPIPPSGPPSQENQGRE